MDATIAPQGRKKDPFELKFMDNKLSSAIMIHKGTFYDYAFLPWSLK